MSFRYKAGFIQEFFNPLTAGPATDFSLYSWGAGSAGRLGTGDAISRSSPVQVGSLITWNNLSVGSVNGGFVTKTDGTLWTWGANAQGQLGQGNVIYRSSPVQIGSLTNWSKMYVGANVAVLAITTNGTMFGWGRNNVGNLGLTSPITYISSPTQIGSNTNWSFAATGDSFSIFGKTDGTLWSAGSNQRGKLGLNLSSTSTYRSSPTQIGSLTTWSAVACGGSHAIALQTNGTMWAWGQNGTGQLGQNNVIYRSSPVQIGALTTWLSISCGTAFVAAIKSDGTLWTWGQGSFGQLGQNNIAYKSSPTQVGSLSTWLNVSCAAYACSAIKTDGTLWSWGNGGSGQIGDNNIVYRSSPVQVGSLTNWSKVATCGNSTIGIQAS